MAMVPRYFTASTKAVAEKALRVGKLTYPGICYIKEDSTFAWVTIDNKIQYIQGDKQITKVGYTDGNLVFYSDNEVVSSVFLPMDEDNADEIIKKITESLDTSGYVKAADVEKIVNNKIGNIDNKSTVSDYIDGLSYDKFHDLPVVNMRGTLTKAITIAELDDGIYKVKGQYIIGGEDLTIRNCGDDSIFIVNHSDNDVSIIGFNGHNIEKYNINKDGTKVYEKYITESWITDRNFVTYDDMKKYVDQMITEANVELVDQRVNKALNEQIGAVSIDEIRSLFS